MNHLEWIEKLNIPCAQLDQYLVGTKDALGRTIKSPTTHSIWRAANVGIIRGRMDDRRASWCTWQHN